MSQLGYDDTPFIKGQKYRVHDSARPQPRVVTPGGGSTPPSDAIVLFDGTDLSSWENGQGGAAGWNVKDGYMEVAPRSGNIRTKAHFGDCQLHLEWAAPEVTESVEGQARGNSGVFMMGIYEIQVLDCFQNPTYPDGTTGGIYGQYPPFVNACRPPGEWQSYDIIWNAPRFDGDILISPARITVIHNGVVLHHGQELLGPTTHRDTAEYSAHAPEGPLELQDHGDLVRFRNIWYRPLRNYDE